MGIKFGHCTNDPSITWKVDSTTSYVDSCVLGKASVVLIRTIKWPHVNWYKDSDFQYFKHWIDILGCDDNHIPKSASISTQIVELYRWRPKQNEPIEVVNYNRACQAGQKARKGTRMLFNVSVQGVGNLDHDMFINSLPYAESAASNMSGISVSKKGLWLAQTCTKEAALNEWHTYTRSARKTLSPPTTLPMWTMVSYTASNIDNLPLSILYETEVTYFPDQNSTNTILEDIVNTLKVRAGVSAC